MFAKSDREESFAARYALHCNCHAVGMVAVRVRGLRAWLSAMLEK